MNASDLAKRLGALLCPRPPRRVAFLCDAGLLAEWHQPTEPAPASAVAEGSTAETQPTDPEATQKALCNLIETAATDNDIPVGFFTRLIWKESRFRHDAVSPKGAQGIAQFMPGTAMERGLEDPFDAVTAIPASANLLFDLNATLAISASPPPPTTPAATASTNGSTMPPPFPTRRATTCSRSPACPADKWADPGCRPNTSRKCRRSEKDCLKLAALLKSDPALALAPDIESAHAPWGVQVAGGFSKTRAIDAYMQLSKRFASLFADRPPMIIGGRMPGRGPRSFYRIRVPVETRAEGEDFCGKLKRAGGSCVVLKP